ETVKKLGWAPDLIHCHGWMTSLVPAYVKTSYKDDPTFKNSKVVYSLYENGFTETLSPSFIPKSVMNGMTEKQVATYAAGTSLALENGALEYSDAVVIGSPEVNPELLNSVKKAGKPVLEYDLTSDSENFYNFYEEITNEELVHVA
ncbi:MAG: starch synthase, partial [Sphingobacteriaceae bacterium]